MSARRRSWRGIAALAATAALAGCVDAIDAATTPAGETAPDFAVPTVDGGVWRLSDHRGHVSVVDLMGVSCAPCRSQAARLAKLAADAPADVAIVSVDVGAAFPGWGAEDADDLRRFREDFGVTWPLAADADGNVTARYRAIILPTLVVVRPDGVVHARLLGDRESVDELRAAVDAARAAGA